jgi:hypothetical protein
VHNQRPAVLLRVPVPHDGQLSLARVPFTRQGGQHSLTRVPFTRSLRTPRTAVVSQSAPGCAAVCSSAAGRAAQPHTRPLHEESPRLQNSCSASISARLCCCVFQCCRAGGTASHASPSRGRAGSTASHASPSRGVPAPSEQLQCLNQRPAVLLCVPVPQGGQLSLARVPCTRSLLTFRTAAVPQSAPGCAVACFSAARRAAQPHTRPLHEAGRAAQPHTCPLHEESPRLQNSCSASISARLCCCVFQCCRAGSTASHASPSRGRAGSTASHASPSRGVLAPS